MGNEKCEVGMKKKARKPNGNLTSNFPHFTSATTKWVHGGCGPAVKVSKYLAEPAGKLDQRG